MKKIIVLLMLSLNITSVLGQENDNPQFTGDNFSLEGALSMFKKSNSLEEFEKLINEENNNVNNLDLNNDGQTDYINVDDIKENDTHVIVLSTFLNKKEKQDIATIGIEKTGTEEATLQIEGDQDLYAENTFVEPSDLKESIDNSKSGPAMPEIITTRIIVNVWGWSCVRFVYAPRYVVWNSPHHWGFYPRWWRPWRIHPYRTFYTRCAPHRIHFYRAPARRVTIARRIYTPKRHHSTIVVNRNKHRTVVINNNKRSNIKSTRNRKVKNRRR
jgi:hypothetical protein